MRLEGVNDNRDLALNGLVCGELLFVLCMMLNICCLIWILVMSGLTPPPRSGEVILFFLRPKYLPHIGSQRRWSRWLVIG